MNVFVEWQSECLISIKTNVQNISMLMYTRSKHSNSFLRTVKKSHPFSKIKLMTKSQNYMILQNFCTFLYFYFVKFKKISVFALVDQKCVHIFFHKNKMIKDIGNFLISTKSILIIVFDCLLGWMHSIWTLLMSQTQKSARTSNPK